MQSTNSPAKKSESPSRSKSGSKQSPISVRNAINERMDPKILDSKVRGLIANAKEKLQRLSGEVIGLKKEVGDLQVSLSLSNKQKEDLANKEDENKEKLQGIKSINEELMAHKMDLEQKIAKAKDELQGLVKLHNQSIKTYSVKINQLSTKERQEVLKREETKASVDQQIAQTKRDNEELRLAIADVSKKVEAMKEIIAQSQEIEQKRLETLSKEAQDLEQLIADN